MENSSYLAPFESFPRIDEFIASLGEASFYSLSLENRYQYVFEHLYDWIKNSSPNSFLLGSVLDFFTKLNEQKALQDSDICNFSIFELWLNQNGTLSSEENLRIRAKIGGKFIPREEYQAFFPIGMGKMYPGSHFVAAHLSPDVDTMVASFWGWIDSFSARVGSGLHYWSLPGGPPDAPFSRIFQKLFGAGIFSHFARTSSHLFLQAMDLITQGPCKNKEPHVTLLNELQDIHMAMEQVDCVPVVMCNKDELFSMGIVRKQDLYQKVLGTVSLRDFCNLQEINTPPYLEVISVVDHHRTSLQTSSVPTALIGDVQSSNVLLAEQVMRINDQYSLGGLTVADIEKQLSELSSSLDCPSDIRIFQKLLQRQQVALQSTSFYIHPKREFLEYYCYLQAILDDTDLLSKVSYRDILCIAQLLNRLQSLTFGREVEVIHFDDLPKDASFVKKCAQRILKNPDMYALYKVVFDLRETEVATHLELCIAGKPSAIFLDTKEQNQCARVGQTKLFRSNFPFFQEHKKKIREVWQQQSQEACKKNPAIDLHIHMISTIANADEVYSDSIKEYSHLDEVWFWTPNSLRGNERLHHFLKGFQQAMIKHGEKGSIEFIGPVSQEWIELFSTYLSGLAKRFSPQEMRVGMVVLQCKAGALNSRKSMITPYLPVKEEEKRT